MGIHAKYDLTPYAFQDKEPNTYFYCDRFIVILWDMDSESELVHLYDTWKDTRSYIDRITKDEFYENYDFYVTGLVFN